MLSPDNIVKAGRGSDKEARAPQLRGNLLLVSTKHPEVKALCRMIIPVDKRKSQMLRTLRG